MLEEFHYNRKDVDEDLINQLERKIEIVTEWFDISTDDIHRYHCSELITLLHGRLNKIKQGL